MRFLYRATLVAALVVAASPAFATRIFTVTPASSNLTISNVSISHTVGGSFVTDLVPQGSTSFTRLVSGTILADEVTGAVEFADLDLMGDSLLGDQILIDRRGNPRDIGDFAFIGLSFSLDDAGNGALSGGQVDFDISLGSLRIHSPSPVDLVGETGPATNMGSSPSVLTMGDTLILSVPVTLHFQDLEVVKDGFATFDVAGFISATSVIPEPSTFLLMSLGLVGIALRGRGRRSG